MGMFLTSSHDEVGFWQEHPIVLAIGRGSPREGEMTVEAVHDATEAVQTTSQSICRGYPRGSPTGRIP
jgi:hypothetical protein